MNPQKYNILRYLAWIGLTRRGPTSVCVAASAWLIRLPLSTPWKCETLKVTPTYFSLGIIKLTLEHIYEKEDIVEAKRMNRQEPLSAATPCTRTQQPSSDIDLQVLHQCISAIDADSPAMHEASNQELSSLLTSAPNDENPAMHEANNQKQPSLLLSAPKDVLEAIMARCSAVEDQQMPSKKKGQKPAKGGLNNLRLVCKALYAASQSFATQLTLDGPSAYPTSLPSYFQKYSRIKSMVYLQSIKLQSLAGVPSTLGSLTLHGHRLQDLDPLAACKQLRTLDIDFALSIVDISPLRACTKLEKLCVTKARGFSDISALAHLPNLQHLSLCDTIRPAITSLEPLSHCQSLRVLDLEGNDLIQDLSPLSKCTGLEILNICGIWGVKSVAPLAACTRLKYFDLEEELLEDELEGLNVLRWKVPGIQINASLEEEGFSEKEEEEKERFANDGIEGEIMRKRDASKRVKIMMIG